MPIAANFIGYIPPIWKKNPSFGEYIEYQVLNPLTNKLERQRIKLARLSTRYNSRTEFRQQVTVMINSLNAKLASGWTPYGETQSVAEYTPLRAAIEHYLRDKGRDLREASMVSYTSVANILLEWLQTKEMDQMASHAKKMSTSLTIHSIPSSCVGCNSPGGGSTNPTR